MADTITTHTRQVSDFWDKIWRDQQGRGKVVIYQRPNWLLLGWLVITLISLFVSNGLSTVLGYIADAALVAWALLEIFKGVNYFRRALGAVVLLLVIMMLFKVGY